MREVTQTNDYGGMVFVDGLLINPDKAYFDKCEKTVVFKTGTNVPSSAEVIVVRVEESYSCGYGGEYTKGDLEYVYYILEGSECEERDE